MPLQNSGSSNVGGLKDVTSIPIEQTLEGTPLFLSGSIDVGWELGFTLNPSDSSKDENSIFARATSDSFTAESEVAWVTEQQYDLSEFNTVEVEWELSGFGGDSIVYIIVSDFKDEDYEVFDERFSRNPSGEEIFVDSLDVSNISSDKYIRLHARATGGDDTATYDTFEVFLK